MSHGQLAIKHSWLHESWPIGYKVLSRKQHHFLPCISLILVNHFFTEPWSRQDILSAVNFSFTIILQPSLLKCGQIFNYLLNIFCILMECTYTMMLHVYAREFLWISCLFLFIGCFRVTMLHATWVLKCTPMIKNCSPLPEKVKF